MINVNRFMIRLLAITVLLAPFGAGQATTEEGAGPVYALQGKVQEKRPRHILVDDVLLRLSPTVKVEVRGKAKASLGDIDPGDDVGVKMIQYRGKAYVDTIYKINDAGVNEQGTLQ